MDRVELLGLWVEALRDSETRVADEDAAYLRSWIVVLEQLTPGDVAGGEARNVARELRGLLHFATCDDEAAQQVAAIVHRVNNQTEGS